MQGVGMSAGGYFGVCRGLKAKVCYRGRENEVLFFRNREIAFDRK